MRESLNKPEGNILQSELDTITSLGFKDIKLEKLDDFRYFTNLERLNIDECETSDISGLKNLAKLKELTLLSNRITDYSCINTLKSLDDLYIRNQYLTDLSFMGDLKTVSKLKLALFSDLAIDFSPVGKMKSLKELMIYSYIQNCDDLSDMKKLEKLTIASEQLTDISGLKGLYLTDLSLDGSALINLSPLTQLKKLLNLNLSISQELDTNTLTKLTKLKSLSIYRQALDTEFLSVPNNLEYLALQSDQFSNLSRRG